MKRPLFLRIPRKPDFIIGSPDKPYLLRWYITPWSTCCRKDKHGNDIEWESATLWQKLVRTLPNIYLHLILRNDDDRALHDHPWPSISIILQGGFWEITPDGQFWRKPGRAYWRKASALHRLELNSSGRDVAYYSSAEGCMMPDFVEFLIPCRTLFITGFRLREWGFACPKGWVHWRKFTATHNHGEVGAGCGEV